MSRVMRPCHPLNRGLVYATYPMLGGAGGLLPNAADGRGRGLTGGTWAGRPGGVSAVGWAAAAYVPEWEPPAAFTALVYFDSPAQQATAYATPFWSGAYTSEAANSGWQISVRPNSDPAPGYNFLLFGNASAAQYTFTAGGATAGRRVVAGDTDGTTKRLFVDGRLAASSTSGRLAAGGTATNNRYGVGDSLAPAYAGLVFNRVLSPAEHRAWAALLRAGLPPGPDCPLWYPGLDLP